MMNGELGIIDANPLKKMKLGKGQNVYSEMEEVDGRKIVGCHKVLSIKLNID